MRFYEVTRQAKLMMYYHIDADKILCVTTHSAIKF